MIEQTFDIARRGLATAFAKSNFPLAFALQFRNRFINVVGGAEKRQGLEDLGDDIAGGPNITGLHEYVDKLGNPTLLASGDGSIWRFDDPGWTQVLTGKDPSKRMLSVQFNDKLIFVNGSDRNFYTSDAGTTFQELQAISIKGKTGSLTNATTLDDPNVTDWTDETFVARNDLVFNINTSSYGLVTLVNTTTLSVTDMGSSGTGIGVGSRDPASGDAYKIIDLVELNIIDDGITEDNVATAGSGTSSTVVAVSGVNFSNTDILVGDYISNTTRSAVTRVTSVSANVNVVSVSGQTSGDAVVFLKSAMPVAEFPHVHYGRLYLSDARNLGNILVSGPGDPEDFTTESGAIDINSIGFAELQPQGDIVKSIKTYQRYLVIAGTRNVYVYDGTTPFLDDENGQKDFTPVGSFPKGTISRFGLENIGGYFMYVSNDGVQGQNLGSDSLSLNQVNISEPIKNALRQLISTITDENDVQVVHYPRRSWLMFKIGSQIYNYNYSDFIQISGNQVGGNSWTLFDGLLAVQNTYFIRRNGDLLTATSNGKVYLFDQGAYSDDGISIPTVYQTGFFAPFEYPQVTRRIKSGTYIKPIFETASNITYNITAEAGFDLLATDEITATARGGGAVGSAIVGTTPIGGSGITDIKYALRWRGEQVKVTFENDNTLGPDILAGFTLYGDIHGRK